MIKQIYNAIDKFYEKCAYHVDYTLDEHENIVSVEKNTQFGTSNFIYFMLTLIVLILMGLTFTIIYDGLQTSHNDKIFLNKYNIQQVCIENKTWTECYGFPREVSSRLYLDINNPVRTLYIKED